MAPGASQVAILSDRAYKALDAFFQDHEDETVEIEMLPPSIQPVEGAMILEEGMHLGIPKETLVLAFVRARELFFAGRSELASSVPLRASRIVLLFDPEHITAAHFRKRRLLACKASNQFEALVHQEYHFLDSILTSPLHRQSKSPTLWYHRLWLFQFASSIKLSGSSKDLFLPFIKAELDTILKAGERHPKNYYAWQFARRMFSQVDGLHNDVLNHLNKASYHDFLLNCALLVKSWCLMHTSDISDWSFLLFLLSKFDLVSERQSIIKDILDWTTKFQSDQESIWWFLRTSLADASLLSGGRNALLKQLYRYRDQRDLTLASHSNANKALRWIEAYTETEAT